LAAFEGKWLVVSGCVQVDAGKPLIIAVTLSLTETHDTDFFNGEPFTLKWRWHEDKWPPPWPHSKIPRRLVEKF
jgi:hypothetical protein